MFVDEALRRTLSKQALDLASSIGYDSTGSVEFLVDGSKNAYFLGMSARMTVGSTN